MVTSPTARSRPRRAAGAGLTEVLVTAAIVAAVTVVSVPTFSTYLSSSSLRAGAAEFVTLVNLARSLAIKENAHACINLDPAGSNRVRILVAGGNPCREASAAYGRGELGYDPRVDAQGWIALQNEVAVTTATAEVVFTAMGAAAPGGTYTISKNGRALHVVVAPSGRVSVAP